MAADTLALTELMARLRDLVTRARARTARLRGTELTSGTLTITNLGDLGVEAVYGVIYPPGRPRWLRQDRRTTVRPGWNARRPPCCHRHPGR
ncbi:2-oxo acid dehydrogenase subunit E2 [Actinopolymorpha sp. B11F2]|uniref:2-oxo acid dehydrogenase subunit E2 n=1 Tax=Actinopolymorpha sp. B11F2 TaxID=3160862 RepID=UPI0032E4AE3A